MNSGLFSVLAAQPLRTKGFAFLHGAFNGVPWHALRPIGARVAGGAVAQDAFVLWVSPAGCIIAGSPPNGIGGDNLIHGDFRHGRIARGIGSVDLQLRRMASDSGNCVASGLGSALLAGETNTASGAYSAIAGGQSNMASGINSFIAAGSGSTTSGAYSFAGGQSGTASGQSSAVFGQIATASRVGQFAIGGSNRVGTYFPWQTSVCNLSGVTTNATPVTLLIGNHNTGGTARLSVTSGTVLRATFEITGVKSDGAQIAKYSRKAVFKNVSGTTTVSAVETVGTDIEDDATTDVAITADDTNDAVQVNVTGPSSGTWRWVCAVRFEDFAFGS